MSIPAYAPANFDMLLRAAIASDLALVECADAVTGDPRYVLCAVARDDVLDVRLDGRRAVGREGVVPGRLLRELVHRLHVREEQLPGPREGRPQAIEEDLLAAVDRLSGWEVTYEDDVALVAVRKRPDAPAPAVTEGTGE